MSKFLFSALLIFLGVSKAAADLDSLTDAVDRRQIDAPILKESASSKKAKTRAQAARGYGRLQSLSSVDPLLSLAKDSNTKVREETAFSLGQLGWLKSSIAGREGDVQKALLEMTRDRATAVKQAALEALGKTGGRKTPELVAPFLTDRNPGTKTQAVLALFRSRLVLKLQGDDKDLPELPAEISEKILKLSSDPNPQVRGAVALYFARNADVRGEKSLVRLTRDRDETARIFAFNGLTKLKSKNAKDAFVQGLRDKSASVRAAAISGLLAIGEPTGPFGFLKSDKSFFVRAAFAQGLNEKTNAGDGVVLNELLQDPSSTVRAEAVKSLAKNKGEGLEAWLTTLLKDPDWILREAAVQASESLAAPARQKFLLQALADPDKNVKAAVLEPLFALPGPETFAQLKKSLESGSLVERGSAITALKDRKESEIEDLAWKTYLASLDHPWVEARQELIEVVAKNSGSKATDRLKEALKDPDESVREKARSALKERGITDLPAAPAAALSVSPFRDAVPARNPRIHFETTKGNFTVEAFAAEAPIHVADFVGHVRQGFYDGLVWHRFVPGFVLQGGDPDGTGWGDAGYFLRAEINRVPYKKGTLGMPRSQGFDTGGSQLFFTLIPTPHLEGQYTVFGQIRQGLDVLDRLERGDRILKAKLLN